MGFVHVISTAALVTIGVDLQLLCGHSFGYLDWFWLIVITCFKMKHGFDGMDVQKVRFLPHYMGKQIGNQQISLPILLL